MYILIGLGNPGKKYAHTRHNAGKMLAAFLRRHPVEGLEVMETDCYMNRSGEWIHKLYKNYKDYKSYENLIVAHDDLDLRLEEWKIHFGRGPRLHKGILSIEQALETKDFWRVRIGIEGRRPKAEGRRSSGEDYVLQPFQREEKKILLDTFSGIRNKIISCIQDNNRYLEDRR